MGSQNTIHEIERHLHSYDRRLGAAVSPISDTHVADLVGPGVVAFRATTGNNIWGSWLQILGSADTPIKTGSAYFDPHIVNITAANFTGTYFMQFVYGESADLDQKITDKDYFSHIYIADSASVKASSEPTQSRRVPAGQKLWVRIMVNLQNAKTLDFFFGLHEYEANLTTDIFEEIKGLTNKGQGPDALVLYVDPTLGDDGYGGDGWGDAFASIGAATAAITASDAPGTIYAKCGIYNEDVVLPVGSALYGVSSVNVDEYIEINGSLDGYGPSLLMNENCTIENLKVGRTDAYDPSSSSFTIEAHSGCTIKRCSILTATDADALLEITGHNVLVEDCQFQGALKTVNAIVGTGNNVIIRNNQFTGMDEHVIVPVGQQWTINNNTFWVATNMYAVSITGLYFSSINMNGCLPKDYISQGGSVPSNNLVQRFNNYDIASEASTNVSTALLPYIMSVEGIEFAALRYDFVTYSKSVVLYYVSADGTGTPNYWTYVYNSVGGRPIASSEISYRDRIIAWATAQPVV